MSEPSRISLAAFVSENERAAVQVAAGQIAQALSQAVGVPWACDCLFASDLKALMTADAAILFTSLLPEVERATEPWPQVEQRLKAAFLALRERDLPVFLCTVLRHVDREEQPAVAESTRIRIRRLNLLATEISRETGVFVIDVDRLLADIGARRLETDYLLGGNAAAETTGHLIASTVVTYGLDALVDVEIQDAAKDILDQSRPSVALADETRPEVTIWKPIQSLGHGRRKLMVSLSPTVEENHAGWLVQLVLQGKIKPREALERLKNAFKRRGVMGGASLLMAGLSRQLKRGK